MAVKAIKLDSLLKLLEIQSFRRCALQQERYSHSISSAKRKAVTRGCFGC